MALPLIVSLLSLMLMTVTVESVSNTTCTGDGCWPSSECNAGNCTVPCRSGRCNMTCSSSVNYCDQICTGGECNSKCDAEKCKLGCSNGRCDMTCSRDVQECHLICTGGGCSFKCDAKTCKLDCPGGACTKIKSSTTKKPTTGFSTTSEPTTGFSTTSAASNAQASVALFLLLAFNTFL